MARRYEIRDERLERSSLQIDPSVQNNYRADEYWKAECRREREQGHAERRQNKCGENQGQPTATTGAGAVGRRPPRARAGVAARCRWP